MCCSQAKLGVSAGGLAILPARIIVADAGIPLFHVEGGIGHDGVGAQVGVLVVGEGVGRFLAEVEIEATDDHIHGGELPGGMVVLLAVNRDIAELSAVLLDELLALHEEAPRAHGRVVDPPGEGLQHLDDQGNDRLGGVKLAALLPFGEGELAEKVFVNMTEDVLGL